MKHLLTILLTLTCLTGYSQQVYRIGTPDTIYYTSPLSGVIGMGRVNLPSEQYIMSYLGDKMIAWYDTSENRTGYYINKIGDQERELLTQNDSTGKVWRGGGVNYIIDSTQYSVIASALVPANFKLTTNSISISCWFKADTSGTDGGRALVDYDMSNVNGTYGLYISLPDGAVGVRATGSNGVNKAESTTSYCDDNWHHVVGIIDKTHSLYLYVDNYLIETTSIVDVTFAAANYALSIAIGGISGYDAGDDVALRDVRLFPTAITAANVESLYQHDYVSGSCGWWSMEDNQFDYCVDLSGNKNYLRNYNLDSASYLDGLWPSLYNLYGYSDTAYSDLISNDGNFDIASEWTAGDYWAVRGDSAYFSGSAFSILTNKRTISFAQYELLKITFEVTSGTARIGFYNSAGNELAAYALYTVGNHTKYIRSPYAGTGIKIYGTAGGTACGIDNFRIGKYYGYPVPPLIDDEIPNIDLAGNDLIFINQAKYNLIIDGDSVKMSDVGEVYKATELVSVNDWFVGNDAQNEVWDSIKYQSGRQYINGDEFIIIKEDEFLTLNEDLLLQRYMRTSNSYSIVSATVYDESPAKLYIKYDFALNEDSIPSTSTFLVTNHTVNNVTISDSAVILEVSPIFETGESVTYQYMRPILNAVQSQLGWDVESHSGSAVNNVTTPMALLVTANGTGAGVFPLTIMVSSNITATLDGVAKFYSDAAGTLNESTSATITSGGIRLIYFKCTSGSANLIFSDPSKITRWGVNTGGSNYDAPANTPVFSGDMTKCQNITYMHLMGPNTLSATITDWVDCENLTIFGENLYDGSITGLTKMENCYIDGKNTIRGDITNLDSLKQLESMNYNYNTLTGSLSNKEKLSIVCFQGLGNITCDITTCPLLAYVSSSTTITWSGSVTGKTLLYYVTVPGLSGSLDALISLRFFHDWSYLTMDKPLRFNNHTQIDDLELQHYIYTAAQVNQILADIWANRDVERPATYRKIVINAVGTEAPTGQGVTDAAALRDYVTPDGLGSTLKWTITTR